MANELDEENSFAIIDFDSGSDVQKLKNVCLFNSYAGVSWVPTVAPSTQLAKTLKAVTNATAMLVSMAMVNSALLYPSRWPALNTAITPKTHSVAFLVAWKFLTLMTPLAG